MSATVIVAGTSTEVGKTWATATVARLLRERGLKVSVRKPVQSYEQGSMTDAEILASATDEDPTVVCPQHRWYPIPVAPPMAAEMLGKPAYSTEDLIEELRLPDDGIVLIEGVGGPRSPVADDGDTVTLAEILDADLVVLIAEAGLGTINSVRLARDTFRTRPLVTLLNRYDDAQELHRRNRAWLDEVDGMTVETSPEKLADRIITTLEVES